MIIPECCEQTFHADRIVGVIHDHTALFRYVRDLHATIHADLHEGSKDCLFCMIIKHPASTGKRQSADRQRRQSIIRVEFSRHPYADSSVKHAVDCEFNSHKIVI